MHEESLSDRIDGEPRKLRLGLKRELATIYVAGWIGMLGCFLLLLSLWDGVAAIRWLVQSALFWSLVCFQAFKRIMLNRPGPQEALFPDLGWGNRITLLRGGLTAMTGGFLFSATPPGLLAWLPGVFYLLAAIADRLDGYVARICRQQTILGTELDTEMDALGLAVAPLLAVWYGQLHWSYLLVGAAYYLYRWGIYARRRRGLPVYPLEPNISRRTFAGFQMGFVAIALLPLFRPPFTTVAGFAFMVPILTGFVIDWLTINGIVKSTTPGRSTLFRSAEKMSVSLLLPGLRLLVAALLWVTIAESGRSLIPGQSGTLQAASTTYLAIFLACLILLGILGRLAAIGLVFLLGWRALGGAMTPTDIVLLLSAIFVMVLGTGRYSLWRWDEQWVNRYDGA